MSEYIDATQVTPEAIQKGKAMIIKWLSGLSDQELRDELKRRADIRKAVKAEVPLCRNCKHCGEGL